MIALYRSLNISFNIILKHLNKIQQGVISIRPLINQNTFNKSKKYLKGKNILYLEQLSIHDNRSLVSYAELTECSFINNTRSYKPPNWFRYLENNIIIKNDINRNISPSLISGEWCDKGVDFKNNINNLQLKSWVTVYDNDLNLVVIGRVVKKEIPNNLIYIELWKINEILSTTSIIVVEKIQNPDYKKNLINYKNRDDVMQYNINDCFRIDNRYIKSKDERYVINRTRSNLFSISLYLWNKNRNFISGSYINSSNINIPDNPLIKYIIESNCIKDLLRLQEILAPYKEFKFYTGGSFSKKDDIVIMKAAIKQVGEHAPDIKYSIITHNFPSALKAKLLAIILVLLIIPKEAIVEIVTDCQTILNVYEILDYIIRNK